MTYIWETLDFENQIQTALQRDMGNSHASARFGYYATARKNLLEDILDEIKRIQPDMTDHGPKHIRDVVENIHELLGDDICHLNGMETYILGLSALFHDVGNVFSRKDHQSHISTIYDYAMGNSHGSLEDEQKKLVLNICKAHCGEGIDGNKNTLSLVGGPSKLERREVRPGLLAPLLRFADELAEGEQRTSHFMIMQHSYSRESIPYHQYANCSISTIDRPKGRICLTYHIHLDDDESNTRAMPLSSLKTFLPFVYKRIEKLNQERQYARHYCSLLEPFKEVSAAFNFWYQGQEIFCDLDTIVFSDLVVPGDPQHGVVERNRKYKEADLINSLSSAIERMSRQNSEVQS